MPVIQIHARYAFRHLDPEAREESVQEVTANALTAFVRLVELGKVELAYPSALARFGVAQTREGRRVGGRLNSCDVLSEYAQKKRGFKVERLDRLDNETDEWIQAVVEDVHTPVPDQASFRIDFPDWLATLSSRNRRLAKALAAGHSTSEVAKQFDISSGRVSQLRNELADSWRRFHGEEPERGS